MPANKLSRGYRLAIYWLDEHAIEAVISGALFLVLLVYLSPRIIIQIPAGHAGVVWKRFAGGTDLKHPPLGEGLHLVLPWNTVTQYDVRLIKETETFDVLTADGMTQQVELQWRYQADLCSLAFLHKYAGPEYAAKLIVPELGSQLRTIIAVHGTQDLYNSHRDEVKDEIIAKSTQRLKVFVMRPEDVPSAKNICPYQAKGETALRWVSIEDVLISNVKLPQGVQDAIVSKNAAREANESFNYKLLEAAKEAQRKKIEALGIREFQSIVTEGITDSYLRWKGIDATEALAKSANAKVVIIGNNKDGLPVMLGGFEPPAAKK